MVKVKICGTTNLEDALFCERAGADALGFIFYPQSKRYITPKKAASIIKRLSIMTEKVGVFVNFTKLQIELIAEETGITSLQLHGDESEYFMKNSVFPIIRAYRIAESTDFTKFKFPNRVVPLFDSYSHSSYGGTGKSFIYEDIPAKICRRSFIAGGISADNFERVLALNPMGIDLVSSLESSPGKKDFTKVEQFFNKLHTYQAKQ